MYGNLTPLNQSFEFFNNSATPWAFSGGNFVLDISPSYSFTLDSIYMSGGVSLVSVQLKDMITGANIFFKTYNSSVTNLSLYNINASYSNEIVNGSNQKFNFIVIPTGSFGSLKCVCIIRK